MTVTLNRANPAVTSTILGMFEKQEAVPVTAIIKEAERAHPGARVRATYWALMTEGAIHADSAGIIRRS